MPEDYRPVACDLHSEFELAAMHRDRLRVRWVGADGGDTEAVAAVVDLVTRRGAEYLLLEGGLEIRLDSLRLARREADGRTLFGPQT